MVSLISNPAGSNSPHGDSPQSDFSYSKCRGVKLRAPFPQDSRIELLLNLGLYRGDEATEAALEIAQERCKSLIQSGLEVVFARSLDFGVQTSRSADNFDYRPAPSGTWIIIARPEEARIDLARESLRV